MKYIIFQIENRELPVLLPGMFAHADLARAVQSLYPKAGILSAGQCVLKGNEIIAAGGSPSLGIPFGRNSDGELIQRELNRVNK